MKITYVQGDLRSAEQVRVICYGATIVYHCASIVDFYYKTSVPAWLHAVNVTGTQHVIAACRHHNIKRLVYTSTQDVIIGHKDIAHGHDELPYPATLRDYLYGAYAYTKSEAERAVLAADQSRTANGSVLRTCAIRPTGMYGERDTHHLPNVLAAARTGVTMKMGDGKARFVHAYAGNVAYAHVLAGDRLQSVDHRGRLDSKHGAGGAGGAAFIVVDDTPVENFFDFCVPFLQHKRLKFLPFRLPFWFMYLLAWILEWIVYLLSPVVRIHLLLTRISVAGLCTDQVFTDARARRLLGYTPPYSWPVARDITMKWIDALR